MKAGKVCDKVYDRISNNLFITITNANFDEDFILDAVKKTMAMKEKSQTNTKSQT